MVYHITDARADFLRKRNSVWKTVALKPHSNKLVLKTLFDVRHQSVDYKMSYWVDSDTIKCVEYDLKSHSAVTEVTENMT